ncbi:MAG TPA: DUF3471 domain-containing protein [Pyrinomonadaceae bacterium]|nr:DUF3471 domain-containing protein [Pyrinomonadaceae bacterium]
MGARTSALALLLSLACVCAAQTRPAQSPPVKPQDDSAQRQNAKSKLSPEALKKYAGRYELEVGLIPVSTLDVTLADGELWVKTTGTKRRRLFHKSKTTFADEVGGAPVTFNRDDEGNVVSLDFTYEGERFNARRTELPPPSLKGTTAFRLKGHDDAAVVVLSGSFNGWNQSQLVFGREGGEWVCRIDLDPGVYQYKFIVDGDWLLDPSNPDTAEDEAGNVNNVLEVKPR